MKLRHFYSCDMLCANDPYVGSLHLKWSVKEKFFGKRLSVFQILEISVNLSLATVNVNEKFKLSVNIVLVFQDYWGVTSCR
jgi:hypothetical protein